MNSWKRVCIADVCESVVDCINKTAPIVDEPSPFKMIRTTNIRNGRVNLEAVRCVTEETYSQWTRRQIPRRGDILLTREAPMGEVGMLLTDDYVFLGQRIVSYRTNPERLNNKFLLYAFQSDDLQNQIKAFASGSTVQHMRVPNTKALQIPFPPLAEQKRIVSIVDQAFEGIDRAIANTKENLTNARELFESYLNATFTQKGDGWIESKLSAVCKFQGGSQPPKSVFSAEKKEDYIRLIQIRDYKSDKYIVYIPKEKAKRFCKPDDVMIGRYGPPLFQILRGLEGAYNVALMKAIPNEEFVSKDFLFYFLKNRNILKYIINSSSRTTGQTGLNKVTIEPYPIAFPTLEKQAIIVAQLQELKAETQRLETIYQQKLAALNELKQSILQKAFTGELTADTANQTTKKAEEAIAA